MKIKTVSFPITVSMVSEHPQEVSLLFRKKPPRKKEPFIGVCILNGSFFCDNPGELFESLSVGERFELVFPKEQTESTAVIPVSAVRFDNTEIGSLPFEYSVIPSMLKSRGLNCHCYLEAKRFQGGNIELAVSVYSDRY